MMFTQYFPEFVKQLEHKLVMGYKQYGDASFELPAVRDIAEIQQECLDICGWGLILWVRLERIKGQMVKEDDVESHNKATT